MMNIEPHIIIADVSLDLARGKFQSARDKLSKAAKTLPESYIMHLLEARAWRGLGRYGDAMRHLRQCCRIAPLNQVAWAELLDVTVLQAQQAPGPADTASDPVAEELERLCIALAGFQPPRASESSEPTPLAEQKQPFPDDASIAVPTESLANLFTSQGAYKKAIRVFTSLIQLNPEKADEYRLNIDRLLERI
jgi:tetratricopeptide (TPR) repeat protein